MVLALFLATFALLLFAAAFALLFLAAVFLVGAGGILVAGAVTLAGSFLVAGAVFGASAVLAVGSQTDAVGTCHLAMMHALMLLGLFAGGLLIVGNRVIVLCTAIAGNHSKGESDSKESGK